jgi:hypothetical protein
MVVVFNCAKDPTIGYYSSNTPQLIEDHTNPSSK